ncbi:MAG: 2-amino-4-hydroxy-6-hydroxymethyldihydropteridine diphosphokinase [Prevotella sp.]|nr:2-amino-4-hydroxy-6-hydroxymethyldihydropteridine diphosphokinase [Prevotella sp.]
MIKHRVFLALGSNLGDKEATIHQALHYIQEQIGNIVRQSALCVTPPWGFESNNSFVNCVIECHTMLSPEMLLKSTQSIEREMGRTEKSVNHCYHDRIIDIDILLYDKLQVRTDHLQIPHPLMLDRDFVINPLSEILGEETTDMIAFIGKTIEKRSSMVEP